MENLYRISYYAGIQTLRLLHRLGRFFSLVFLPLWLLLRRAVHALFRKRDDRIREGFQGLKRRFAEAGSRVRAAWKRHPLVGVLQVLYLPVAAAKHYKGLTRAVATVTAMACAVAVLLGTVRYWGGTTYALALADDSGDVWCYVTEEAVLQNGVAMANERLGRITAANALSVSPSISLSVIRQASVWNENEICDHLLSQADVAVEEACGLYIDGTFYGAVNTRRNANRILTEILDEYCEDKLNVKASFVEKVDLVEGLYPEEQIVAVEAMKTGLVAEAVEELTYTLREGDTLTSIAAEHGMSLAELLRLNPAAANDVKAGQVLIVRKAEPHLRVLVSGAVQYEAEVPFTVERVPDASMYEGKERTRQKGQNGKSLVTAEVTYLDGKEQSSAIIEQTIIEEPVKQIVAYGTKKKPGKGRNMVWPVPHTRFITQYYSMSGSRHRGLDIWARDIDGKDIVAADDGTVLVSVDPKGTSYWSYGKYVVIAHSDGYQTLYAHCSELLVKEGQTVKKGQVIAKVGNTGRSTSPHLHFEVTVNGRNINPLDCY